MERRDLGANLSRELARADLQPCALREYLAIRIGAIIGRAADRLPARGHGRARLRQRSGLPGRRAWSAGALPRFWVNRRQGQRLKAFNSHLADTITLIANALRSGASFLQAIELVVRETQPPMSTEFNRVIREVNLGLALRAGPGNMVRRVRSEDLELMATAITIQHQVGGNLAEILDSIAFTIRERVRIKGEIRTLTAQQRMSGYVVAGLPIGLIAASSRSSRRPSCSPCSRSHRSSSGIPAGVIILALGGVS